MLIIPLFIYLILFLSKFMGETTVWENLYGFALSGSWVPKTLLENCFSAGKASNFFITSSQNPAKTSTIQSSWLARELISSFVNVLKKEGKKVWILPMKESRSKQHWESKTLCELEGFFYKWKPSLSSSTFSFNKLGHLSSKCPVFLQRWHQNDSLYKSKG